MLKIAIVNYSDQKQKYILGQQRQESELKAANFPMVDYFCFREVSEIGAPSHSEVPYAFKPYAIEKVREMGYDIVLWMDAAVYPRKAFPWLQLLGDIEKEGVLLFDNIGYSIADYTSDACLEYYQLGRNKAKELPMIMACFMGFDFRSKKAKMFQYHYLRGAEHRIPFIGDWSNDQLQVSTDPDCKGHRHDQSAASIIAWKLHITPMHPFSTHFAYVHEPTHQPMSETVSFVSAGF